MSHERPDPEPARERPDPVTLVTLEAHPAREAVERLGDTGKI